MMYRHRDWRKPIFATISNCFLHFNLVSDFVVVPHTCAVDNGGCNADCEDTPIGVQCSCSSGYLLKSDGRSCQGESM